MTAGAATSAADETARRVACLAAVAVIAGVVAFDALLIWIGLQRPQSSPWLLGVVVSDSVIAPVVGLLIVRRRPRHPVGWLLIVHGPLVAVLLGSDAVTQFMAARHMWPSGMAAWNQVGSGLWPLLYVCIALVAYIFPDGHLLSRRWRRFLSVCLAGYLLFFVSVPLNFKPGATVGLAVIAASLAGAVIAARSRLRRAAGEERVQLLWVVWAATTVPVGLLAAWVFESAGSSGLLIDVGVAITGVVVPVAIGIGILRHRLFDIELVLSRALTYEALTALVIGVYGGAVAGLGTVFANHAAAGLIGVGVVAVAIEPVHTRLRRRVERWVYGDRSDPYTALRRLSQRVEGIADPAQVVTVVTGAVAEALRVDRVSIDLDRPGRPASAAAGTGDRESLVRVPLVHHACRLGDLVIHVPRGRQLSASDRAMVDDLARHAAVAVNAVHLTLDLQESRARLVTAREEERRRLRRDLHDGLGPSLAAMVLNLGVVRAMTGDPATAGLVDQVRADARAAITEIRRLVEGLRPPSLDEVGLVAALALHAHTVSGHGGDRPLVIQVTGPASPLQLPAAVEVAAYRIAMEAMANVIRHAQATRCLLTVTLDEALKLTIDDNGIGLGTGASPGIGLSSMRERAVELGGSLTVLGRAGGGTSLHAVLPVSSASSEPAPQALPAGAWPAPPAQAVGS
jgi:two-component system, NarL family, sensor kinase